jgi:2-haloacid dehalogenase
MAEPELGNIGACVFDAYGTLLDFNAAVDQRRDRIGPQADALSDLWRRKQLEYTWLRSLMGRHNDFWQVTTDALDFSMASVGIEDKALRDDLLGLYRTLAPYPEVVQVLQRLKDAELRTAILSNGEPSMLADAVDAASLGPLLNEVFSVETVGVFKPHPSVYQVVIEAFGLEPQQVLFQSANGWDIAGAASFGFTTVWINRGNAQEECLPNRPAYTLSSLDGLPALIGLG